MPESEAIAPGGVASFGNPEKVEAASTLGQERERGSWPSRLRVAPGALFGDSPGRSANWLVECGRKRTFEGGASRSSDNQYLG